MDETKKKKQQKCLVMAAFYPTYVIGKSTKLQQFVLHTIALLLEGANNH
jgi:hypothetical protein